ncbi:MAG: ABC transporter ATP-binding protein [Candidatus Faecousia sp.]|nr:ABC transporter ATP-binding protein [Clostridiales bacterium]MDY4219798.1 ABC transporter ATP-binding protein [Candidatus Faecousia sp.]
MIQATGVVKQYGSFRALDGLSLTVPKGSVYGLVGPNGAGKSTLIRCITGAFRPEQGEITLEGENVWENPRVKARMAHIPDEIFFYPQSNLTDLQRFYAGFYPGFDKELWGRLEPVFQLPRKTPLRRFSKGMQKQAAFWLALACRPEVLILDEPVDGLDPMMRRQVWQLLLGDVAQNGTTVLVSSHNLRELEDVCDRVGILDKGRMLLERSLSDLQENMAKIQMVPGENGAPQGLDVLHESRSGRLLTLVVRGRPEEIRERVAAAQPVYFDLLPLSLEEIFIYELGGISDEVRNMVL